VAQAPEFQPAVLRATFEPRQGDTPYLTMGNYPVLGLALLLLAGRMLQGRVSVKDSS
jgi:apolipoprotein N-acyltransferase